MNEKTPEGDAVKRTIDDAIVYLLGHKAGMPRNSDQFKLACELIDGLRTAADRAAHTEATLASHSLQVVGPRQIFRYTCNNCYSVALAAEGGRSCRMCGKGVVARSDVPQPTTPKPAEPRSTAQGERERFADKFRALIEELQNDGREEAASTLVWYEDRIFAAYDAALATAPSTSHTEGDRG